MSMMDIPEFTVYEINELANRARKSDYYAKAKKFIEETLLNDLFDTKRQAAR